MTILSLKDFKKKNVLKNDTMNESELQRIYNFPINPRDSKIYSDRRFVNTDSGAQNGTHWTCFVVKDKKSYYFDSFGRVLDNLLSKQLSKALIYHNYKIQNIDSKLCGSYRLNFFYLIERMNYYDTVFKCFFTKFKYAY